MASKLGAQREQHLRFAAGDYRNQHGCRSRGLRSRALPKLRIEVDVSARGLCSEIVQRWRYVQRQSFMGAGEEVLNGVAAMLGTIHHAVSCRLSDSHMAKNSPADATPNIRFPLISRCSPSATRS